MRLWSLHPSYLDTKGLVALWREALLAKHVLEGKTKGYTHHPQLHRFKECKNPVQAIHQYLAEVHAEAERRGYRFAADKFERPKKKQTIPLTTGQLAFEKNHLLNKLQARDEESYLLFKKIQTPTSFRIFVIEEGPIAAWEII